MIQPIKQFHINRLTVSGFKGYAESRTFQFGSMNVISGHMGVGKSSIADAIAFAITGVSFFGSSKIDFLYHQNTRDLKVEMEFEDDCGNMRMLTRCRKNDEMEIMLDGIRITQRDLTILFGERDLFLSMFNPQYFIGALGAKGRDLLERYLPEIPKEEILNQLDDRTKKLLEQQDFMSAEAYAKQLRNQIVSIGNEIVYARGQLDLRSAQQKEQAQGLMELQAKQARLQERINELETRRTTNFDGSSLEDKLADLYARYEEIQREEPRIADTSDLDTQIRAVAEKGASRKAESYQSKYSEVLSQTREKIRGLGAEFNRLKHIHESLRAGVQCPLCRQMVTEETLPTVKSEFASSIRRIQNEGYQLTEQLKEIQELDVKAQEVFLQYQQDDISACEAELQELNARRENAVLDAEQERSYRQEELKRLLSEIQSMELDRECGMLSEDEFEELKLARKENAELSAQIEVLSKQVLASPEAAEKQEQEIDSMQADIQKKREILSALGYYISKRVEINFSRLKMNRVAISLYDVVKTTGEVKDAFRFTYEDRGYLCLSHSEKIRAGLEVAEMIKRLLGVTYPTFIDDVESVPVIDNVRPSGQVFVAKVIKGSALQVQIADAPSGARAA